MSSFDEFDAFEASSLSARAMAARPAPYLDELNPAQREAVERTGQQRRHDECGIQKRADPA